LSWLHSPSYVSIRDSLIDSFTSRVHVFKRLKRVIFIGGGSDSPCRAVLEKYLKKYRIDTLFFRAEDVWLEIAKRSNLNSLEMEEQLAQLADMVVIIVESPGTFTELGAFSLINELREKLLPILDLQYKNDDKSFIKTGPVSWIEKDSTFSPPIYVNFSIILEAAEEIGERLDRISIRGKHKVPNLRESPKHLLFLLCDLVAVIGPAPPENVDYFVSKILEGNPKHDTASLLSLARAIGLLKTITLNNSTLYYRPFSDGKLVSFTYLRKKVSLSGERAKHLSVLQKSSEGRAAIDLMGAT